MTTPSQHAVWRCEDYWLRHRHAKEHVTPNMHQNHYWRLVRWQAAWLELCLHEAPDWYKKMARAQDIRDFIDSAPPFVP